MVKDEIIDQGKLVPDHPFRFRNKHRTIEQIHRLVNQANIDFNGKKIMFWCVLGCCGSL